MEQNIFKHKIKKEDTLQSLALQYETSIEELKNYHNSFGGVTNLIVSDVIPIHLDYIMIDKKSVINKEIKHAEGGEIDLNNMARYRCEQNNLVLVDGNPNFSGQTKTQYLVSNKKDIGFSLLNVILEDYVNAVQPAGMERAFELIKHIEQIRNNITFSHSEGKIDKVINLNELHEKWKLFLDKTCKTIPFYNELSQKSPETINDFVENGKKEFSNEKVFSEVISKNLFYHTLINAYKSSGNNEYSFAQQSQLFPNIILNINVVKSLVSEDEDTITYRLVGTLDKSKLNIDEIKKLYEELYQPIIKFSFTEFDYIYRITYQIEKNTGQIVKSTTSIKEFVKNNYDVITKFELRRIEL
ncbi:LysM peptidoglycan-binding domain-containing protein [Chryseobacterium sp. GP-SGM7]|uniref:LysM peptidoglycan-binding domain-containing protein n=1 Tax=Chryseobacterium sp. GP-SGM7 TaxID=3411323 RepID=UPI003B953D0D